MTPHVLETFAQGVVTLTLNRPDRLNALSPDMLAQLTEALTRIAGDANVRALVLTGAGRGFCAGGDVKRMAEGAIDYDAPDAVATLRRKMEVARLLHELPQPTVAARTQSLASILDLEAEHQTAASRSADHREATRAFLDKRSPVFTGR